MLGRVYSFSLFSVEIDIPTRRCLFKVDKSTQRYSEGIHIRLNTADYNTQLRTDCGFLLLGRPWHIIQPPLLCCRPIYSNLFHFLSLDVDTFFRRLYNNQLKTDFLLLFSALPLTHEILGKNNTPKKNAKDVYYTVWDVLFLYKNPRVCICYKLILLEYNKS